MVETGDYSSILKREGLRSTRHRNAVLEVIGKSQQPVSAEQIFLNLKEEKNPINLSSVYRILDNLVSKDMIIKSFMPGNSMATYEMKNSEHKHHLICTECKKMFSIEDCPLDEYVKQLRDKTGFDITGHNLEIIGVCKDCKLK